RSVNASLYGAGARRSFSRDATVQTVGGSNWARFTKPAEKPLTLTLSRGERARVRGFLFCASWHSPALSRSSNRSGGLRAWPKRLSCLLELGILAGGQVLDGHRSRNVGLNADTVEDLPTAGDELGNGDLDSTAVGQRVQLPGPDATGRFLAD